MKNSVLKDANTYTEKHKRKKRWYKIFICLAAAVVFCTTYALILPAITMERITCDIPEHTHTIECYRQITTVPGVIPVCSPERLELHQHTDECYDYTGEVICGYADFVVHQHDASCYDEDGYLWCPLPEIYTHTHTKYCYAEPESEPEISLPETEFESGAPDDNESESYYDINDIYSEFSDIFDINDINIFDETESEESESFETEELDTDALKEDESGETDEELYFSFREQEPEEIVYNFFDELLKPVEPKKPVLICKIPEIILHEHTEKCFDRMGNLICSKTQVLEHVHNEDCFEECEIPADTDTLTCGLMEDENHTHTPLCYGTWELICELEEHTHTEECQPDLNLGETEPEPEEPEPEESEPEESEPEESEPEESEPEESEPEESEPEESEPEESEPEESEPEESEPEESEPEESEPEESEPEESEPEESESEESEPEESEPEESEPEESESEESEPEESGPEETEPEEPESDKVLSDDGAYVSLLSETGSEILSQRTDTETISTVVSGDTVIYNFRVNVTSYSDESFTEGKIKLEFVLPLTEEQAAFDTASMTWLDLSEGYEPVITTETRIINDNETACQVLTGYMTVSVPGEAEISAVVNTTDLPSESEIYLHISAAMEFNSWDGICPLHQTEEKLTIITSKYAVENIQQLCFDQFKAEIEAYDPSSGDVNELRKRIDEAYGLGKLTEENYKELCEMLENLTLPADTSIAEAAVGENWKALRDSGWFEEYSGYSGDNSYASRSFFEDDALSAASYGMRVMSDELPPSDVQVIDHGGSKTSEDRAVTVSKTISGTELENVFDITLSVQTSTETPKSLQNPTWQWLL